MANASESPLPPDERRRQAWESVMTIPLTALGIAFIIAYSILVLVPDAPAWLSRALIVEIVVAWVAMLADLIVRTTLTRGNRISFLVHQPIDILGVVLPFFRAMRVVDLTLRLPFFARRTANAARAQIVTSAVLYAGIYVYVLALATLHVERYAPGANITDFGLAIWWAFVTLATVGYGDTYPVTSLGRIYAVALMAAGVAIVGTTSGLMMSYITERVRHHTRPDERIDESLEGNAEANPDERLD